MENSYTRANHVEYSSVNANPGTKRFFSSFRVPSMKVLIPVAALAGIAGFLFLRSSSRSEMKRTKQERPTMGTVTSEVIMVEDLSPLSY